MQLFSILPYNSILPQIGKNTFIASGSAIIGDVKIGQEVGIWFNCVLRGDVEPIIVGNRTNIQDGTIIHVTRGGGITVIGDDVTIGHKCLIHAAELQNRCFVGMGSIVMDGAVIEEGGWLAAGGLLTNNKIIRSGEIWAGSPAKFFRKLTKEEDKHILISAQNYVKHVYEYLTQARHQE